MSWKEQKNKWNKDEFDPLIRPIQIKPTGVIQTGEDVEFQFDENFKEPVQKWDEFDNYEWVKDKWEDEDEENISP